MRKKLVFTLAMVAAASLLALYVSAQAPHLTALDPTPSEDPVRTQPTSVERMPVLLELYTSEGCSSCPPADRLLEELAGGGLVAGADIVPLSLHVDYWNHLGWRDPYSSADYSKRQEGYARALRADNVFTPQLVIDGESQLNGSDRRAAVAAIARAGQRPKAKVTLVPLPATDAPPQKMAWRITIDAASLAPRPAAAYLFYAVTEDGLASSVAHGENSGRTLRHVAVVRSLQTLGRIGLYQEGRGTRDVIVDLDPGWEHDRLHLVAWVADGPNGKVLGSARAAL